MPPPPPRVPAGFFICGMMSMLFSAAVLLALVIAEVDAPEEAIVIIRGGCVLVASLGAIATEALWKVRREAYRASLALAFCCAAWVLAVTAITRAFASGAFFLFVFTLVIGPMLYYIRRRSRQLWPPAGVRVPAPRP
ncbi:MAG TPA: hypothetical protein VFS20_14275 [Longimicrobium sp.]|nr:hypothetical protein [Longimicrobium sp.]